MKTGIDPITEPVAAELKRAAARMSKNEAALGDALLEIARVLQEVYPLLDLLAEGPGIGLADRALLDVIFAKLSNAEVHAIGTHAAVVGELLGVEVH